MFLWGLTLGLGLIITAILIDLIASDLHFNLDSLTLLYRKNVTHWIILTSPFFLSAFFLLMGKIINDRERVIALQLSDEKDQFQMLEQFVSQLQEEKFKVSIPDTFKNQKLSLQLHEFRTKLAAGKSSDEKRTWENQGLATFGELLRKYTDTDTLCEEVLRYLVKYLSCNQASVFILDATEEALDLKACYAYDRKKFVNKSIAIGQGLVGQCFLEKETVLLYDVPKDYIRITSGLGLATPTCVVIVPLKHNDHVAGVIELASFKRLQQFEVTFLEKCAQAFASVLQSTRVNQNVRQLLEQSQQQTEELRAQEEEMRQNMEELRAIQEQMSRQLTENTKIRTLLEARETVLAQTTILSESDLYGTITYVNEKFIEVSQYTAEELVGKGHNIVRHPDMPKSLFRLMWATIKSGKTFRGIVKNRKKDGTPYWVDATIVPIFENGKVVKYIGARYHIQDADIAERLFERQAQTLSGEKDAGDPHNGFKLVVER